MPIKKPKTPCSPKHEHRVLESKQARLAVSPAPHKNVVSCLTSSAKTMFETVQISPLKMMKGKMMIALSKLELKTPIIS